MNKTITSDIFFKELIREFPNLETLLNEEDIDMIHMRMEVFSDYTIEQIKTNNYLEIQRCFNFHENRLDNYTPDLENALIVSYCESLMLGNVSLKMGEILKLMPSKLKKKYLDYQKWYNELCEKSKK